MVADVKEADLSLERDDIFGISGAEQFAVLFGGGEEGLGAGSESTVGLNGFEPSKEGKEEMV